MKTHLGARTDQKTLEGESKFHLHTEERLVSKSPFSTFRVPNDTLKDSNFPLLGFGLTTFGWQ